MTDFLLEIGTEEIPAGYFDLSLEPLVKSFQSLLQEQRLDCDKVISLGTPRRFILFASGLPVQQATLTKDITGPPERIAVTPDGKPTEALIGFAKRNHVDPKEVKLKETDKGKICYISVTAKGEKTENILSRIIPTLISKFSFPKSMWWENKSFTFARPIRYLTAIFGKKALKILLPGIPCTNKTYGHHIRNPKPITLASSDFIQYKKRLASASVMVDNNERKNKIRALINQVISKYGGSFHEAELLDEVTNLVEWPDVIECSFNQKFLSLPEPVLESAMKGHQRYFPIRDKNNKLLPKFIVITNGVKNESVKEGNERVLTARLTDARFFWEKDKKVPLGSKIDSLKETAYLGKLGSLYDKMQRLKNISSRIADELKFPDIKNTVERAAELAKTDLLTEMVGEFPDLQGIMGYEYSRIQGESEEVALAIKEHYMPRTAGDDIPHSPAGIVLSLTEKFDNITACFTLGLEPTGSQDPYAIRRQVLGIIRIIDENNIKLNSFRNIIQSAIEEVWKTIKSLPEKTKLTPLPPEKCAANIMTFFKERLINKYQEQKYPYDIIQAVMNSGFDKFPLFKKRLDDLLKLSKEPAVWPLLVEAVERTYNIQKGSKISGMVKEELLKEPEEKTLWDIYRRNAEQVQKLIDEQKYYEASILYTTIFGKPVHTFFEKVFVNADDVAIKNNRILILKQINQLYSQSIADLSCITTAKPLPKIVRNP